MEDDCAEVAELMIEALWVKDDGEKKKVIREKIRLLAEKFPIPDTFIHTSI
jgi:glycine/serine hydroxymethyltransferase